MRDDKWMIAGYGCLLGALVPVGVGDALVAGGAVVPLLAIAIPVLLILLCSGFCFYRWTKTI